MAIKPSPIQRIKESETPEWAWLGKLRKRDLIPTGKGGERRRHVRIKTDEPGYMKVLEPASSVRWLVHVIEVSRSGVGLVSQTHVEPGSIVQIHFKQMSLLALVRNSIRLDEPNRPGSFRLGVEIQHVF